MSNNKLLIKENNELWKKVEKLQKENFDLREKLKKNNKLEINKGQIIEDNQLSLFLKVDEIFEIKTEKDFDKLSGDWDMENLKKNMPCKCYQGYFYGNIKDAKNDNTDNEEGSGYYFDFQINKNMIAKI